MGCQSRYVGEMAFRKPIRSYLDSFVLNTGFKLQADLLFGTALKLKHFGKSILSGNNTANKGVPSETGSLQEGDLVRVRPIREIVGTLNFRQKLGGCFFLEDMENFCGGEYVVEKKVGHFFDELAYRYYKTSDVVLLRNVCCTGNLPLVKYTCNRSCLYFWKEAWLQKINSGKTGTDATASSTQSASTHSPGRNRVRVRSRKEIQETLDPDSKLDGCFFMDEMWEYCGHEFTVGKKVDYFFNEHNYTMSQARDVVILDGLHCKGKLPDRPYRCDRYCAILWKTDWLEAL